MMIVVCMSVIVVMTVVVVVRHRSIVLVGLASLGSRLEEAT